jgi:hypothetical protein
VAVRPALSEEEPSAPAAGMKIHIDPKTGTFSKEPAPGTVPLQLSPQEMNALSTSHQGLVEVPSPVPGGGMMLNVQGRFQNPVAATIGPDGKVRLHHLGQPETADPK